MGGPYGRGGDGGLPGGVREGGDVGRAAVRDPPRFPLPFPGQPLPFPAQVGTSVSFGVCAWAGSFLPRVVQTTGERVFFGVTYLGFMAVLLATYSRVPSPLPEVEGGRGMQTLLTKAGRPSAPYFLSAELRAEEERRRREAGEEASPGYLAWLHSTTAAWAKRQGLEVAERDEEGNLRYCRYCGCIKPDRTHHCSACHTCILKFDHHCPFLNTCIGHRNWKFFVLMLFWSWVTCGFGFIVSVTYAITAAVAEQRINEEDTALMIALAILNGWFTLVVGFWVYTMNLLLRNRTNLEGSISFGSTPFQEYNPYDLGAWDNFTQVCGTNPFLACLPVFTTQGNGEVFPMRPAKPKV